MADLITGKAFGWLFRTFEHSARRLETRDRYRDPEEDDAFARYLAGSPENPSYVASRDYWLNSTIRAGTDAGQRFTRVRVVPEPLTPYLRFRSISLRLQRRRGRGHPLSGPGPRQRSRPAWS